jgi:hypothetical protein
MCDIAEEVKQLREIKDIKDELNITERVMTDQSSVIRQYADWMEKNKANRSARMTRHVEVLRDSLDFKLLKIQRLKKDAEGVENSVHSPNSPSKSYQYPHR